MKTFELCVLWAVMASDGTIDQIMSKIAEMRYERVSVKKVVDVLTSASRVGYRTIVDDRGRWTLTTRGQRYLDDGITEMSEFVKLVRRAR